MTDTKVKKKILFAALSMDSGGVEKSLVNLLNEMPKDLYDIDLLLFRREGMFLDQIPKEVNILDTPAEIKLLYGEWKKAGRLLPLKVIGSIMAKFAEKTPRAKKAYRWKKYYSQAVRNLKGCYDVAIAFFSGEVFYFVDEKVNASRKMVFIHNDYRTAQHPKKYDLKPFDRVNYIVTISEKCESILKEEFPQYADKIKYVQNITSSKLIRKKAMAFRPKEIDNSVPTLLSIGRLNEQKGFDFAVEAVKILVKERGVKVKWYIIGEGELRARLQKEIDRYSIQDYIELLGLRENPYPYIQVCYVFIQPSRYEGKSVALDEAKIIGKPIIVTNYPTAGDQIKDRVDGLIVDMKPEAIADSIEELINKTELYNTIQEELLRHDYGNQEEIKKYIELIES